MKKGILIILVAILTTVSVMSLFACSQQTETSSEQFLLPEYDFIQPWLVVNWQANDYTQHLSTLKQAGYEGVIIQYLRSGSSDGCDVYYPTQVIDDYIDVEMNYVTDIPSALLTCADELNMKVYLGLSVEDEWWRKTSATDEEWMQERALLDNAMIDELNKLYGDYSSFEGWYWAYEIWNDESAMAMHSNMLNTTLDYLVSIEDTRPLMFSPYISGLYTYSYVTNYQLWASFFNSTRLRDGDIFAPQDSIGKHSGAVFTDENRTVLENNIRSMKDAVTTIKPEVEFYVNCELFYYSETDSSILYTASLERIKEQIEMANKYDATKIVTFSYSHYCVYDINEARGVHGVGFHDKYVEYINEIGI